MTNSFIPTSIFELIAAQDAVTELQEAIDEYCKQDDNWIRCTEGARILGVSRQFIQDLINRNCLLGVKGKKAWVYKPSVDDRLMYIEKHGKPTRGGARKKGQKNTFNWLKEHSHEL